MKSGVPIPRRSPLFYEILAYLADHPDARDTVEGIVEWWLLEQRIKRTKTQVKIALEQLVGEQLVAIREERNGRLSYRVNRSKLRDVHRVLTQENTGK